jgi:hypothetical protein
MIVRIVQFLIGAALVCGGGLLGWLFRAEAGALFPASPGSAAWLLVIAVLAVSAGAVLLVTAILPQPGRQARIAAEIARREEALNSADKYYSERSRAADRDWRSGDLPPAPAPTETSPASPEPAAPVPPKPVAGPFPSLAAMSPIPLATDPPLQPLPSSTPPPQPVVLQPVLQAAVSSAGSQVVAEQAPAHAQPAVIAPAAVTPPAAVMTEPAPAASAPSDPAPAAPPVEDVADRFARIRAAIDDGQLEDADRLLAEERSRPGMEGAALAELTGLAGDHAAAAGRPGNAKWLWRLSLKRFADAGEINSSEARHVSERLRLIDQ